MTMKKKTTSMAGEGFELPIDVLLFQVFSRLPLKSIIRCMSVCKLWRSSLSTSDFAKFHFNSINTKTKIEGEGEKDDDYPINRIKLLVSSSSGGYHPIHLDSVDFEAYDGTTAIYSPAHSPPFEALMGVNITATIDFPIYSPLGTVILSTLDGLVCVGIISWNHFQDHYYGDLVLWNPSTGAYTKIPNFNSYHSYSYHASDAYGLCYDSSSDDYKLLHVSSWKKKNATARIFSLKSNSWRKIEEDASVPISGYDWTSSCFSNGILYFTVQQQYPLCDLLICFDVNADKFKVLSAPPVRCPACFPSFMIIRGSLRLVYSYQYVEPEIELWRMEGVEGWVKTDSFPVPCEGHIILLHVMRNGKLLVHNCTHNNVMVLDSEKKKANMMMLFDGYRPHYWKLLTYNETLISPNMYVM